MARQQVTTQALQVHCEALNRKLNRPTTGATRNDSGERIQFNPSHIFVAVVYGGYQIQEYTSEKGTVAMPFTHDVLTKRECLLILQAALNTINYLLPVSR